MKDKNALVLFSGGQDSTTCLFWAMKNFDQVETFCFSYGQRHAAEVEVARSLAEKLKLPFHLRDLSVLASLSDNALTNSAMAMDSVLPPSGHINTFVPGRNMIFLSLAAVLARSLGILDIIIGVSQTDFSGYPDCRDTFIRSLNVTLNLAMEEQFIIHTPLMWLNKAQTWQLANDLGALDIVRNETLTCYNGIKGDGCGHCPSCKLRNEGLRQFLNETMR
ncbi:MAG: 7-cyano-7-deazaguanine synthase QueC [Bacteroidales bacterium]|nr:7-cyano-7-deazaguanine synthase QueC [Bacteroidales bacterium]MCL2133311.1 7-cyano-7-deazaguanine synthase QueC [Bacteroidales bacterium]